jgi:hypothetical protein
VRFVAGKCRRLFGSAFLIARSWKRHSRPTTRYVPFTLLFGTRCARTSSRSSLSCVRLFVCQLGYLRPPRGRLKFIEAHGTYAVLHIASIPPPRDLKVSDPAVRDLTLAELGLSPSSILHLRFVDDSLNRTFVPLTRTFTSFRAVRTDLREMDCFFSY